MSRFGRQLERRNRTRRVVLRRTADLGIRGTRVSMRGHASALATQRRWADRRQHGKSPFRTYPIVRLTDEGIDWGATPQPGDEIGYGMDYYRTDDCLQAAIATATQVPIEKVPDPALDKRLRRGEDPDEISRTTWQTIDRWASERGLVGLVWGTVPVPRERWIGVIETDHAGRRTLMDVAGRSVSVEQFVFNDHCLVMSYDRLVFDPSCSVKTPPGKALMVFDPSQITYGISFDQKEE